MPIVTEESVEVAEETAESTPCGPARMLRFSDSGGLTQFGAFVEILPPGSRSSLCHWHASEDEMVYMLEGEVTVIEGGVATPLRPGQVACFKAGTPAGHFLRNDGTAPARYLVVGTRARADVITYPDHDRVMTREGYDATHATLAGEPAGSAYAIPGA